MELGYELVKGNEQYIATSNDLKGIRSPKSYQVKHLIGGEQVGGSNGLKSAHLKSYFGRLIADCGFELIERAEASYD